MFFYILFKAAKNLATSWN